MMKTSNYIKHVSLAFAFMCLFSINNAKAQSIDTVKFQVNGVCDKCKARIENAVLTKGVKFAEWSKQEQLITVIYKTDKTNLQKIHQSIADAGHDTEKIKATDEAYSKLHKCCAYRSLDVH